MADWPGNTEVSINPVTMSVGGKLIAYHRANYVLLKIKKIHGVSKFCFKYKIFHGKSFEVMENQQKFLAHIPMQCSMCTLQQGV